LREVLNDWMPEDIADLFDDLEPQEDVVILSLWSRKKRHEPLNISPPAAQEQ